ncbi:MAG TPA: tyrosine--tRNA ligase [Candidatus Paceibacterota bacterium]|nr:tyrosine--tRNA ligase [Candidatus Paceibacterota bacterium]
MKKDEKKAKIEEILSRGVGDFYDPEDVFRKKLQKKIEGKYQGEIIIKFGVDPTRPDIHLGHAVVFRRLRALQDLGCKVVFLVGDFTAQIGDPTGKSKVRPEIEQREVEENMKTYLDQVGKILRTEKEVFSWMRNSEWFYTVTDIASPKEITMNVKNEKGSFEIPINPNSFVGKAVYYESTRMQKTALGKDQVVGVSLRGLISTLRSITHSRLIERDMFQERIKNEQELSMHEMLYPVLQGIDSVMIERIYGSCDLEVGGTDQTFNMLMGRDVMKINKMTPQAVLSFKLLVGTDGVEKMSKSLGNYISITDAPSDMYGKVMSIPDTAVLSFFELCTYTPIENVRDIEKKLAKGANPRDAKMQLAKEIVSIYHGEDAAGKAEKDFVETFQKGGLPKDLPKTEASEGALLLDILLSQKFVKSKTDFKRLVDEGAISVFGGEKITDHFFQVKEDMVVKIGKKRFLKISVL